MATATDFKFAGHIAYIQRCKSRSQGAKAGSYGCILNLRIAVNNSQMAKAIGFKFNTYIDSLTRPTVSKFFNISAMAENRLHIQSAYFLWMLQPTSAKLGQWNVTEVKWPLNFRMAAGADMAKVLRASEECRKHESRCRGAIAEGMISSNLSRGSRRL